MKLYFTRHGKTEWNNQLRMQGWKDSPLLPQSFNEISLLGQHLSDVPFAGIYSSPLKRAKETAEGIKKELKESPEIQLNDGFKELNFGELEGKTFAEADALHPESMKHLRHAPHLYDPSGFKGETYESMLARSSKVILDALENHQEGPLLFVGHGAMLTTCLQHLLKEPIENIRDRGMLDNNSLTILSYEEGEFSIDTWNDTSFLSSL